jgi:hypothetical protein
MTKLKFYFLLDASLTGSEAHTMSKFLGLCFFISTTLFSFPAWAHQADDWRGDARAFKSVRIDRRDYLGRKQNFSDFERGGLEPVTIDESEFQKMMEQLSGKVPVILDGASMTITERGGAAGRNLARRWLTQEYVNLKYAVSTDNFSGGANLIAEKAGTSGKTLILSSHLDSVGNAGANDDGAGTVAAFLIAKALSSAAAKNGLRIVAFDREEAGLVGSAAYTASLNAADIIGDIQLEMMSFNAKKDGHFHVVDCDRPDSAFLTAEIMRSIMSLGLPLTRVAACTDRSDHSSFWKQRIPAVVVSENFFGGDGDPCYHRKCDVVDGRLDFKYAANITRGIANAVAELIE